MAQQIEKLARFVAETTLEQVPKDVQRLATLVVLASIGVILAGASRPEVQVLRERIERDHHGDWRHLYLRSG